MNSVTSNAVAGVVGELHTVTIEGSSSSGAYFIDSNNHEVLVSEYSSAQLINSSSIRGYVLIPYAEVNMPLKWAIWDLRNNTWGQNISGLTAIFRK